MNNNFENNSSWGYYPEDLIFDEKTQTFQKVKKSEKNAENLKKNCKNNANFAQNGLFGENMLSKMFEGNEMLSTLLKGGAMNSSAKSNLIMQALSNLNSPKKQKKEKNTIIKNDDFFEEF